MLAYILLIAFFVLLLIATVTLMAIALKRSYDAEKTQAKSAIGALVTSANIDRTAALMYQSVS